MIWFWPDNIESGGKGGLRNIEIGTAPLSDMNFCYAFAFLIGQALILKVLS